MRGRIRTVKPEAFTDEDLWDLEVESELPIFRAFVGLWTQADREGRFEWRPRALKAAILPYWDGDFSRVLDALTARGLLVKYAVHGREYGLVRSFLRHQVVNNREAPSEIPPPPESPGIPNTSTRAPRDSNASGAPLTHAQAEGKGREGKGREGEEDARASALPPLPPAEPPELEPGEPDPGPPTLSAGDLHRAWATASGGQTFASVPRADLAFRHMAETIRAQVGDDAHLAARAYLLWVFHGPDGPVRSGRMPRPRPWSLQPGVLEDLPRARDWWVALPADERAALAGPPPQRAAAQEPVP